MAPKKNKLEESLLESKNEELVEVVEIKTKGKGKTKKEEIIEKPQESKPQESKPKGKTKKEKL